MIAFLAGLALAGEPRVVVERAGAWWVAPTDPAGAAPPASGWLPREGQFVASDADRIRATFRSGDFDVTLWVVRADCARRIAGRVELAPKPGSGPGGVALLGGAPVRVGEAKGDALLVTYAADGILTTGWVPASAVDEVWNDEGRELRAGDLLASGDDGLAIRSRPRGRVTAILGGGSDQFWTLSTLGERGRWTEVELVSIQVEGRGWVRSDDVREVDLYDFGRGFGSGGFGCSHCVRISVPAGTEVRAPGGEVFAVAVAAGEVIGEGPLADGVLPVSVQTAWGAVPGTIACGAITEDGACVSAP